MYEKKEIFTRGEKWRLGLVNDEKEANKHLQLARNARKP